MVNRARIKKSVLQGRTENSVVAQKLQRSYKLKLYANKSKLDTARYTNLRFNQYMNIFLGRIFFGQDKISTKGMGTLANQAKYKSHKMVKGLKRLNRKEGVKINVPYAINQSNYAKIEKSKDSRFDYWVKVSNQWTKAKMVAIPAKSHKVLNKALKDGWKLSGNCEVKFINNNVYAIVFLSKAVPVIKIPNKIIGCDVGIIHSVVTSDGYKGHGLSRVIRTQKRRYAERRRQGHKVSKKVKTCVKQILDREAKGVIRRSVNLGVGIAVESPKRLANLRSGNLQGWARSCFANRLEILGKENGVKIIRINPYQTSITCSKCGVVDKESRDDRIFNCVSCGHIAHADVNAAINISNLGRATL